MDPRAPGSAGFRCPRRWGPRRCECAESRAPAIETSKRLYPHLLDGSQDSAAARVEQLREALVEPADLDQLSPNYEQSADRAPELELLHLDRSKRRRG